MARGDGGASRGVVVLSAEPWWRRPQQRWSRQFFWRRLLRQQQKRSWWRSKGSSGSFGGGGFNIPRSSGSAVRFSEWPIIEAHLPAVPIILVVALSAPGRPGLGTIALVVIIFATVFGSIFSFNTGSSFPVRREQRNHPFYSRKRSPFRWFGHGNGLLHRHDRLDRKSF